jgi:hypothetical protein
MYGYHSVENVDAHDNCFTLGLTERVKVIGILIWESVYFLNGMGK